jgi:hypothetical protein
VTLLRGSKAAARPDGKGGYLITLPHDVLNRLKALRGPRESHSDITIRVASASRGSWRRRVDWWLSARHVQESFGDQE